MSIIRDVVEVFKDISDYDEVEILKNKPKGSLTRMTKDAVLQFPVIASNSLDIQLIGLVNKALERNFASLLKIAFSLNSITDEKDLTNFIRQFHQNTGLSDREYTSNLVVDKLVNECKIEYKFGEQKLTESDCALIKQFLVKDSHRLLREYLSELNLGKLNDKMHFLAEGPGRKSYHSFEELRKASQTGEVKVASAPKNNYNNGRNNGRNSGQNNGQPTIINNNRIIMPRDNKNNPTIINKINIPREDKSADKIMAKNFGRIATALAKGKEESKPSNQPSEPRPTYTQRTYANRKVELFGNADVVKANEIMPLPLEVKVYIEDDKGNVIERDFLIGIKAVIHPVSSDYMIDSMMDGYRRGKFFFNFIKATTGEIKFFKDFVFMVDNMKKDALKNASGNNNKWFSFLKRRALLAKFKNTLRMKHQLLPNTSIVLSGEEADTLKQQGVDILDPKVAKDLISHYFLLSVVVVDPALEIVHFIYDGDEQYSSMSVMALNRESKEDSGTKQILSLLKSRPQF